MEAVFGGVTGNEVIAYKVTELDENRTIRDYLRRANEWCNELDAEVIGAGEAIGRIRLKYANEIREQIEKAVLEAETRMRSEYLEARRNATGFERFLNLFRPIREVKINPDHRDSIVEEVHRTAMSKLIACLPSIQISYEEAMVLNYLFYTEYTNDLLESFHDRKELRGIVSVVILADLFPTFRDTIQRHLLFVEMASLTSCMVYEKDLNKLLFSVVSMPSLAGKFQTIVKRAINAYREKAPLDIDDVFRFKGKIESMMAEGKLPQTELADLPIKMGSALYSEWSFALGALAWDDLDDILKGFEIGGAFGSNGDMRDAILEHISE